MTDQRSELYFEAHVTIEPVFDGQLEVARHLAGLFNFKVADLLMRKRSEDSEERSRNDTFMTGHSRSLNDLQGRLRSLINALKGSGFEVWRYKIEDTVMDSRHADVLGLLEA